MNPQHYDDICNQIADLKMDAKIIQLNLFGVMAMITECWWFKVIIAIGACAAILAVVALMKRKRR